MQDTLVRELTQKKHLAALGLAVAKINHDLRNMLASAQLLSDRLANVTDPLAQRLAPKLVATLDRAIRFCQATLTYGRATDEAPKPRLVELRSHRRRGGRSRLSRRRPRDDPQQGFRRLRTLGRSGASVSSHDELAAQRCGGARPCRPVRRPAGTDHCLRLRDGRNLPFSKSPIPGPACPQACGRNYSRLFRARRGRAARDSASPSPPISCAPTAAASS